MHAPCTTEKAALVETLPGMSAIRVERAAQMKTIEEWTRRLAEELSARERNFEKSHTKNAVVVGEMLTEQFKHLSAPVTELEGEVMNDKKILADLYVKLMAAKNARKRPRMN